MSEGLELESRRRIYDFLVANPGTHLRRIGHALGMSTGMLSYHLSYLERNGVLKAEEDGHRKRYFIARAFVEAQRRILAVLRQDVPRKILVELLTYEGRTFAELQASVGVSKSTLSYHLQKLMHRDPLKRAPFSAGDPRFRADENCADRRLPLAAAIRHPLDIVAGHVDRPSPVGQAPPVCGEDEVPGHRLVDRDAAAHPLAQDLVEQVR